jgi:O-glycosyl hydrolase
MREFFWAKGAALLLCSLGIASAQEAVRLPEAKPVAAGVAKSFEFVTDGPSQAGWTRPEEIPRVYFDERLPALFVRTVTLEGDVPHGGTLRWIFTGPRAGFTVELTTSKVRVIERYYDSVGLGGGGSFPDRMVRESERQFRGHVRTVTVVADSHLSLVVLVNGEKLLEEPLVFDVMRHQLVLSAPRTTHAALRGSLLRPGVEEVAVTVHESERHQQMLGFGGSPSIPTYAHLSEEGKSRYWDLLRRYNLLLDREYPMGTQLSRDLSNMDDMAAATPHYYGDNFPNSEVSDFAYSRKTIALGGKVIYEMWALPRWAEVEYNGSERTVDAWNRVVRRAADPEKYAAIVVHYCQIAKEKTGAPPAIVGIENEVEQPPSVFNAMTKTLRKRLDEAGFQSVKIHMADAPYLWMGIERTSNLKKDADAWRETDYVASHVYDWQEFLANPDMYDERLRAMREQIGDKPYLATEICINDGHYQEPSYRIALQTAQLYHKHLTELDAVALLYCWLILDTEQPTFMASRSLLMPDKTQEGMPVASSDELRVLGAYSRHVLEGMHRVSVESTDKNLLVTAFAGVKDERTLVLLNRGVEAKHVKLGWPGATWTESEHTNLYDENIVNSAQTGMEDVLVQPGEIVTVSTVRAAK